MENKKRGQISTEYLIVMGFVTFLVITLLGTAFFYVGQIRDTMKMNQINDFGKKIVNSAETVYFAGEPSRVTVLLYVPQGVKSIKIDNKQVIVVISTDTGDNTMSFASDVPLAGTLASSEGVKKIRLAAEDGDVLISQV